MTADGCELWMMGNAKLSEILKKAMLTPSKLSG
jgi:hypothetical protein